MIIHKNKYPWGDSVSIITENGCAKVEMTFENVNPGVCYLSGLSVIPEKRLHGLGTFLIKECEKYCKLHNIFRIDLHLVQDPGVLKFYYKLGYKTITEEDGLIRAYKIL